MSELAEFIGTAEKAKRSLQDLAKAINSKNLDLVEMCRTKASEEIGSIGPHLDASVNRSRFHGNGTEYDIFQQALSAKGVYEVEYIYTAVACLDQAIGMVKHKPQNGINQLPQKITLKWLYEHVPFQLVLGGLTLLALSFGAGLGFSQTSLYALINSKISIPDTGGSNSKDIEKQK